MSSKRSARTQASDEWLRLDRQLCFALYATSLAMTKLYKPLLEPLGLTYPQYLAMLALWEAAARPRAEGLTVSELGERLTLDSGTLTPLLKRLEASGLLSRQRDAADERRVRLQLTAEGLALKARAAAVPTQVACSTGVSLEEALSLMSRLKTLRDQLTVSPDRAAERAA
jgi:DNA-binding MarR family transcriptional regulator